MRIRLDKIVILGVIFCQSLWAADAIQFAYTFENTSIGQLVDKFTTDSGIDIERRFIEQEDLKILLLETVESETSPDVVFVPSDHAGLYRPMRFSPIDKDMFNHGIGGDNWDSALVDNKHYGIPIIKGNHLMLFYNKSLVSSPANSWQELAEQATSLRAQSIEPIAWNYNEMYFFVPFLGAFEGWPVSNGRITLNTPAMAKALEAYRSLRDGGLVNEECDYDCAFKAFSEGNLAYTINGDWALKDFKAKLGDDLGIAILPKWEDKPLKPMYSTHIIVFPDSSLVGPKAEKLKTFANYMVSFDVQDRLWNELKVFPVDQKAYENALANMEPELRPMLEQLGQGRAMPSERAMSYTWGAMAKSYSRFMNDILTAEEAAELMQKLAERELSKDE